jgi:hypothetical protein
MGGFSTVWKGTAFNCPGRGNEIELRHAQFESGDAMGECNGGNIIGQSRNRTVDDPNSKFTSQLTIHLPLMDASNALEGETVECARDGVESDVIGNHTITYTRFSSGMYRSIYY